MAERCRSQRLWLLPVIVLVHAIVYWQVPTVGFVTDDFLWLAEAGRDLDLFEHATSREPFGYLRPLFHLLLAGSRSCFPLSPLPLHLTALCASVTAALLLWSLLRRLTGDCLAAWCGTLLFVVHPSQAIALVWISSLPSLLATVGVVGAALAFYRYRTTGRFGHAVVSLALHGFALLAKEEGVLAVVWLLAIEWWLWRSGRALSCSRQVAAAGWLHALLFVVYLAAWHGGGNTGHAYAPEELGDWLAAGWEPLLRLSPLLVDRHLVRTPFAEPLLLVAFVSLWRARGPGSGTDGERLPRASLLAALGIALVGLLPSSLFLWRFGYDKLDRLLHPALPAAALTLAVLVVGWRHRFGAVGSWRCAAGVLLLLVLFVPFTRRSMRMVGDRAADGQHAAVLWQALCDHEALLRQEAMASRPVRLRGYPGDWVYPAAPARAIAPGLEVLVDDAAPERRAVTLCWHARARAFRRT